MASPTFNGQPIFDSSTLAATFSEGVLWVPSYTKIYQPLHFNGEIGDRVLTHGYPDLQWMFKGLLSAPSGLATKLAAIQAYIDEADADGSTYRVLVDSFGNTYQKAQIRNMTVQEPHVKAGPTGLPNGGFVCSIIVTGIIQSVSRYGVTS